MLFLKNPTINALNIFIFRGCNIPDIDIVIQRKLPAAVSSFIQDLVGPYGGKEVLSWQCCPLRNLHTVSIWRRFKIKTMEGLKSGRETYSNRWTAPNSKDKNYSVNTGSIAKRWPVFNGRGCAFVGADHEVSMKDVDCNLRKPLPPECSPMSL